MSKITDRIHAVGDGIIKAQDTFEEVKTAVSETKETVKVARAEKKADNLVNEDAVSQTDATSTVEKGKPSKGTLAAIIIGSVLLLLLILGIALGDEEKPKEETTTAISTTTTTVSTTLAPIDKVPTGATVDSINGVWGLYKDGNLVSNFTGIAANTFGEWYIVNGLVDFSYSGSVKYDGKDYTIKEGKVYVEPSTTKISSTAPTTYASKLDSADAMVIFEHYGERAFPYGFKPKWVLGTIARRTEEDGSVFLKVKTDITNEYGAERETVAEGRISEDGEVTYFFVY